jgi:hypothetical protein
LELGKAKSQHRTSTASMWDILDPS